jgi:hypothetical protein
MIFGGNPRRATPSRASPDSEARSRCQALSSRRRFDKIDKRHPRLPLKPEALLQGNPQNFELQVEDHDGTLSTPGRHESALRFEPGHLHVRRHAIREHRAEQLRDHGQQGNAAPIVRIAEIARLSSWK